MDYRYIRNRFYIYILNTLYLLGIPTNHNHITSIPASVTSMESGYNKYKEITGEKRLNDPVSLAVIN